MKTTQLILNNFKLFFVARIFCSYIFTKIFKNILRSKIIVLKQIQAISDDFLKFGSYNFFLYIKTEKKIFYNFFSINKS